FSRGAAAALRLGRHAPELGVDHRQRLGVAADDGDSLPVDNRRLGRADRDLEGHRHADQHTHTFAQDMDVLLAGPGGTPNAIILSDACGQVSISGVNLTLDDTAAAFVPGRSPDNSTACTSGTYKP